MTMRRALTGAVAALAAACCAALAFAPAAPALAFFTVPESPALPPPPPPSPPFTSVLDVAEADPDFTLLVQAILKTQGDFAKTLDLQVRAERAPAPLPLPHTHACGPRCTRCLLERQVMCLGTRAQAPKHAHTRARPPPRRRLCLPQKALLLSACLQRG